MTRLGPEATLVENHFAQRLNTVNTIVYAMIYTTLKLIDSFNKANTQNCYSQVWFLWLINGPITPLTPDLAVFHVI